MDPILRTRLTAWHKQIDKLKVLEEMHFQLEATEKPMYYKLYENGSGRVADKEAHVYRHPDWTDFQKGLSESRANWHSERRKLELLIKAFDAEYLGLKRDQEAIKRSQE